MDKLSAPFRRDRHKGDHQRNHAMNKCLLELSGQGDCRPKRTRMYRPRGPVIAAGRMIATSGTVWSSWPRYFSPHCISFSNAPRQCVLLRIQIITSAKRLLLCEAMLDVFVDRAPYEATVEKCMSFFTDGVLKAKVKNRIGTRDIPPPLQSFLPYISRICHAVCMTTSGFSAATFSCQLLSPPTHAV